MAPGAKSKFGAPIFEPDVFRKRMYCIEKSRPTCDIVGTYWCPPPSFGARGIVRPLSRPWVRRSISGPLAWFLVEICIACLYSNQNVETATSAAVEESDHQFWAWLQKNLAWVLSSSRPRYDTSCIPSRRPCAEEQVHCSGVMQWWACNSLMSDLSRTR